MCVVLKIYIYNNKWIYIIIIIILCEKWRLVSDGRKTYNTTRPILKYMNRFNIIYTWYFPVTEWCAFNTINFGQNDRKILYRITRIECLSSKPHIANGAPLFIIILYVYVRCRVKKSDKRKVEIGKELNACGFMRIWQTRTTCCFFYLGMTNNQPNTCPARNFKNFA